MPLNAALKQFGFDSHDITLTKIGNGLINQTYLASGSNQDYILQGLNTQVFTNPDAVNHNIQLISNYFKVKHPDYLFVHPLKTIDGKTLWQHAWAGYFRMFPFINNTKTLLTVQKPSQAFEAAAAFGRFTSLLLHFPVEQLQETIPGFHHLLPRVEAYNEALKTADKNRLQIAASTINALKECDFIVTNYKQIINQNLLTRRVIHHDTKISNVLFDEQDKAVCVIDYDTIMPGYVISDLGDMMRTYLCAFSEEHQQFDDITVREEYFEAILKGYLSYMLPLLTEEEKKHLLFAGYFMIYMQALRFLTDFLKNDVYYGSSYENQNWFRAHNQLVLLQQYHQKAPRLQKIILSIIQNTA